MRTITIKVKDSVSEKILWFLNHFSKSELEILETSTYQNDDTYLKSVSGMEKSIIKESQEPTEKYVAEDELDW